MAEDLKQFDMKALREEKEELKKSLELSKISKEELNKLDVEKQKEVRQAKDNSFKNRKRLYKINDMMNYVRTVSKRNPEDILVDIDYVIGEVNENFKPGMTTKLSDLETKLNELDRKNINRKPKGEKGKENDKGKEDEKDKENDKDKADKDESEDKKGPILYKEAEIKIENNKKRIEEILKSMSQPMKDTVKYAEYLIELRELQAETKELFKIVKPKDKGQDIKDNKSQEDNKDNSHQSEDIANKPKNSNENIENRIEYIKKDIEKYKMMMKKYENNPTKCEDFKKQIKELEEEKELLEDQLSGKTPEQKLEEVRNRLMNRMRENQIDILKLMKAMDKYKNDPEKYNACAKKIKEIEDQNKKIYEALFAKQIKKDQQQSRQEPNNEKNIDPKDIIYMGQEKKRPQIKFDITTGYYTYTDEYDNKKEYNGFPEDDIMPRERQEKLMQDAMKRGLTRRQAKKIDYRIYVILLKNNGELLRNYIDSFKNDKDFDKGFDIIYNLKKRNRKILHDIGRKNAASIKSKAKNAKKLGIAKVYKDKFRTKLAAIWGAIGISAIGGSTYIMLNENNPINDNKAAEETQKDYEGKDTGKKSNEDLSKRFKENLKAKGDKDKEKETEGSEQKEDDKEVKVVVDNPENSAEQTAEEQKIEDEAMQGYYNKKANNKQQDTSKQQNNSGGKKKDKKQGKGDKEQEEGDKIIMKSEIEGDESMLEIYVRSEEEKGEGKGKGKVIIEDDEEKENGKVIIVDDGKKEGGDVIIVDDER